MKKLFCSAVAVMTICWALGLVVLAPVAQAATLVSGDLIKASSPSVYYYGENGKRYVFPDLKTYQTWYGDDFSTVKKITDAQLGDIAIGGNVTYRPGARMIKVNSDPKVYAVSKGGVLRWIKSEEIAVCIFGSNWSSLVSDLPDSFFVNYTTGAELTTCSDYDKVAIMASAPTINADKSLTELTICSSIECLIALAENCQIGEFDYAQTIPFPFSPLMTYNAVTSFKIKGWDANGDCTFDQQNKTVLLSVTPENKQKMIADGKTGAEIDAQLQMINDSYKAVADQVNQCQGTNENVATYLKNLEIGKNVSVSCSLGVGSSTCTYEPNISCVSTRVQNHSNPNCTLSTLTSELGLYPGVSVSIPATGYNDGSQLSWQISDPSIASVSATNGESVMIGGIKAGSTELKITDNAVGADCFVTIPVTVGQNNY